MGASHLIWDFSLDEFRQQRQRFLPAEIARLDGKCGGYSFLRDIQFRAAEDLIQRDCGLHFAGQTRSVEFVRVADAFVGLQFEIGSTKGVALAGAEIGERHLVSAAHFRVQVMNFASESIRRKPLCHCVRVQERPVNFLRRRPEHSMETYRVCTVCCHNSLLF
jgi:hypothetical protein